MFEGFQGYKVSNPPGPPPFRRIATSGNSKQTTSEHRERKALSQGKMKRTSKAGERRSAAQMHALAAVRREIVLRDSSGGRKYLREYSQAFRKFDSVLSSERLSDRISSSKTLLIGDYHALPASQHYAATLIDQIAQQRPVVLCVEAVLSRDQAILDSWWRREISEQELRKRLRFDRDWGYPWEPLLELLSTARDHAEAIYGIDCMPRDDMRRIRSRDRHAAAKIREARGQHPDAVILVLFGESHMAPEHLPDLVKKALPWEPVLTVLQNVDALYWQAVGENAAAVSIGEDTVCVFNSSPLEKYESYRLCLERWNSDDQADFAPAVYNVIFSLARTLGFRLDSPHNGTQPKYLADSLPEVVTVDETEQSCGAAAFTRETLEKLQQNSCWYVAETNQFIIREFNMPQVAGQATRFLCSACRNLRPSSNTELENALMQFGLRLLCPEISQEQILSEEGEGLYKSYIAGRISRAAIRKLFLRG